MGFSVVGGRAIVAAWDAAQSVPPEQLPPLSPEQREVARKLGIPETDYARSALAIARTQELLLGKTRRLARVLESAAKRVGRPAEVRDVVLDTNEGRFDVVFQVRGQTVPARVSEDVVDDYFETGSEEAEQRILRIVDRVLSASVPQ